MCVFCVQWIGEYQRQLQDHSTPEWRRAQWVQDIRTHIQQHNVSISSIELAEPMGKRAAILNQGKPPGCHADDMLRVVTNSNT